MKRSISTALVYIGLVIGAGFASGREIFQYFNIPTKTDLTGIVIATLGFAGLAYITMALAKTHSAQSFDQYIEKISPLCSVPIKIFMALFMFCGYFVMLAASGALFENTFGCSIGIGISLLSLICFVVFIFDLSGIVVINSALVPLMIVGMTFLCIASAICGVPAFLAFDEIKNNFLVSALCYVSYNTITSGAVLVPLAHNLTKKNLLQASVISGFVLGTLILLVWAVLNIHFDFVYSAEMPLLNLAAFYGEFYKVLYSIILFMALCTTAISHGFGLLSKFKFKNRTDRIIVSALMCLLAMPFAKFGFSALISKLYFVFGILGLLWTVLVINKFLKS